MKCPKCGNDNNADSIFCEKCDWRLSQPYKPERKIDPLIFSIASAVVGILAIVPMAFAGAHLVSVLFGGAGLVLGGYAINLPRFIGTERKETCMILAGIGLFLCIIGFIYGIYKIAV